LPKNKIISIHTRILTNAVGRFGLLILVSSVFIISIFKATGFSVPPEHFNFPENFPSDLKKLHAQAKSKIDVLDAWHTSSQYFLDEGDFPNAIKASQLLEKYGNKYSEPRYVAGAFEVQGIAYDNMGQLANAIDFHLKALRIREKLGRKKPIALSLSQLGSIYYYMQSYSKAEGYWKKSLSIFKEIGEEFEAAETEFNIGLINRKAGKLQQALKIHRASVRSFSILRDSTSLSRAYAAIGENFRILKQVDSALFYQKIALKIRLKLARDPEISNSYSDLCALYLDRNEFDLARQYGLKAKALNLKLGVKEGLQADYANLSQVEEKTRNYELALGYLKNFNSIRDSIINHEAQEEIAIQTARFDFQKQQYKDSLSRSENIKREELRKKVELEEKQKQANIQYSAILIVTMVLLGSVFLVRKVSVSVFWLEGAIFFTALFMFEFLYLILDPWVEEISDGIPVYKFGINLLIGFAVFYGHSFLERTMKKKLLPSSNE